MTKLWTLALTFDVHLELDIEVERSRVSQVRERRRVLRIVVNEERL